MLDTLVEHHRKLPRKLFQNQVLISAHTHLSEQIEIKVDGRSDDSVLMWLRKSFTVVRTTFLTLSSSALFCSRHQHLILSFLHSPYTAWNDKSVWRELTQKKKVVSSLTGATRTRKLDRERERQSRKSFTLISGDKLKSFSLRYVHVFFCCDGFDVHETKYIISHSHLRLIFHFTTRFKRAT